MIFYNVFRAHIFCIASGEDGIAAESLKHFHAATSSLKSMCTSVTAAGIEDCRRACGGHGFLQSSGLPEHLNTYLQACTVEGENHMLTQQVGGVIFYSWLIWISNSNGADWNLAGATTI